MKDISTIFGFVLSKELLVDCWITMKIELLEGISIMRKFAPRSGNEIKTRRLAFDVHYKIWAFLKLFILLQKTA